MGKEHFRKGFSLAQHIKDTFGEVEETGVSLNLTLFGYKFLSIKLWDFTHNATIQTRINYQLSKLSIDIRHQFSFFLHGIQSINPMRWIGWFINSYVATQHQSFLSGALRRIGQYLYADDRGIHEDDKSQLKHRVAGIERHRTDWKQLNEELLASIDYADKHRKDLIDLVSGDDEYTFYSTEYILSIAIKAFDELEQHIESEKQTIWWRLWLANNEHVNAYQDYLSQWSEWVQVERSKMIKSCVARVLNSLITGDLESDDLVYSLLKITQRDNVHHQSLEKYPVRKGLSIQILSQLDDLICRYADSERQEQYQQLQTEFKSIFAQLRVYKSRNDAVQFPIELLAYQPRYRYWPNVFFKRHNQRHDFFHDASGQKNRLFTGLQKLPWVTRALKANAEVAETDLLLSFTLLNTLEREVEDTEAEQNRWFGWLFYHYRNLMRCYSSFLNEQKQIITQSIVEQASIIQSSNQQANLMSPININRIEAYSQRIKRIILTHALDFTADELAILKKTERIIDERVCYLRNTPTARHVKADKVLKSMVQGAQLSPKQLESLRALYQEKRFSIRDFPDDDYVLDPASHKQHFHSYAGGLIKCVIELSTKATKSHHQDEQLHYLDIIKQNMQFIMLFDSTVYHQTLNNTIRALVVGLVQSSIDCGLSTTEQLKLLTKIAEIVNISPVFEVTQRSVEQLINIVRRDDSLDTKRTDAEVELIVLGYRANQQDLLQDIQSATNYVNACPDDSISISDYIPNLFTTSESTYNAIQMYASNKNTMLTYLAAQARHVSEDACSNAKLESARADVNSVFGFFKEYHSAREFTDAGELFSRPYTITCH